MKRIMLILVLGVLVYGCEDTTDDLGNNPNGPNQDPPTGVQLVFPYKDELCNEGTDLTPTESTVFFEWEPNDNAEMYVISIENLNTGAIEIYETSDVIEPITIQRAEAFRWFVSYDFQEETKTSEVWNFYNAGPGLQSHPPFPAEIISPSMAETMAATTSVTLQWTGSDVDNDIVAYDVYFGVDNPPALVTTDTASNQLTVSVTPGTIYYWSIVSKDAAGNTSESGIYQFNIAD